MANMLAHRRTTKKICVGVIVGARGLKGDVRVKSFTDDPGDVASYGPVETDDGTTLVLKVTGESKGVVVVRIDSMTDRTDAEALRGQRLYVERTALPKTEDEDEYYHTDLIGLAVVDETDTECGTVIALYNFGGGDMIDIRRSDGHSLILPFTAAVVPVVDVVSGRIVVSSNAIAAAEAEPDSAAEAELDSVPEDDGSPQQEPEA